MQLSKLTVPFPKHFLAAAEKGASIPWLLVWTILGACLRFVRLAAKPPWTDEFTTLVFSLGNSYSSVPVDEAIALDSLLQPLRTDLGGTLGDVVVRMLGEDVHPPLYFGLAHLWMKLLPMGDYVSIWVARSLPACLGILSIGAIYLLAKATFRSQAIANLAAALMAVSPYGIFIAQEARHYTLATLFVILSLLCFVGAIRQVWRGTKIPTGLMGVWTAINILGLMTHYFFVLTLGAQALAFLLLLASSWPKRRTPSRRSRSSRGLRVNNLLRLGVVALGTGIFGLLWLGLVLPDNYGGAATEWIQSNPSNLLQLINPVFQLGAAIVTMLVLLPVESPWLPVVIVSGIAMLIFVWWIVPILVWGAKTQDRQPYYHLGMRIFLAFVGSAIAIFFGITYLKGIDITRGARYSFVYFPGVILVLGACLGACWEYGDVKLSWGRLKPPRRFFQRNGKLTVAIAGFVALLSAITVISNLGYQKYYRPDLLVPKIEQSITESVLIATTHQTLVQTGEMMGIAWQLKDREIAEKTDFLLVHQDRKDSREATTKLAEAVKQMPRSLDLWTVNFYAPVELHDCVLDPQPLPHINGYDAQLYHCPEVANIRAQDEF